MRYQELHPYRYRLYERAELPFMNKELAKAAASVSIVNHPYFTISKDGVSAAAAYAWDGATGVLFQGKELVVPSLIHDIGCQAVNLKMLPRSFRSLFDREYYLQSLAYGVGKPRAEIHYAAIRAWGVVPKEESSVAPYAKVHSIEVLKA